MLSFKGLRKQGRIIIAGVIAAMLALGGCQSQPQKQSQPILSLDGQQSGIDMGNLLEGQPDFSDAPPLQISAASSLTESLNELQGLYYTMSGVELNLNFGASSVLKTQIEQGAEADLFLSANFSHYDSLEKAGLIEKGKQFVQNSLVLAVAKDNTSIQKVEDMAQDGVKVIFANDDVPVGKYTAEILANYDKKSGENLSEKINANVVSKEENVRQVLSKVALGEGDCAIVYDTDITEDVKDKVRLVSIDEDCNVKGEYWVGLIKKDSPNPAAENFYDYLTDSEASSVFEKYGFTPIS